MSGKLNDTPEGLPLSVRCLVKISVLYPSDRLSAIDLSNNLSAWVSHFTFVTVTAPAFTAALRTGWVKEDGSWG